MLIRMSIENHQEFNKLLNLPSYMTAVAITAACNMLNTTGKDKIVKQVYVLMKIPLMSITVIKDFSTKLQAFYSDFNRWHCGSNQLKRFKELSFVF